MKKHKVVVIVDNPLRDLPACALLAGQLAEKCDVWLVPMSQAGPEIFRYQPDLVLLNYLRQTNLNLVLKLIKAGIPFSVLDTEGGLFMKVAGTEETTYTMTLVKDATIRNQISQFFVWGHDLYQYLKSKQIYPEKSLQCLGTPRMDFYHQSFQKYFTDKPTERPMILINTSFAGNNPRFSNREAEEKMLVSRFGYTEEFISNFFQQLDEVMKGYIELTKFLAKRFPDVDFVLRPHPFEKWSIYEQSLADCPNVKVDCTDTVAKWIWMSKALVHYECSTALEAAFAGRPSFSLGQYRDIRPNEQIQSITDYAESYEAMAMRIESVLRGNYQLPADLQERLNKIEQSIYHRVDGLAYQRIAKSILSWFEQDRPSRSFSQSLLAHFYGSYYSIRTFAKWIRKKGQLVPAAKRLDFNEVQTVVQKIRQTTGLSIQPSPVLLSTAIAITKEMP